MRQALGKVLEAAGICVLGAALAAGLGLMPGGEAHLPRQIVLTLAGLGLFAAGWRIEATAGKK